MESVTIEEAQKRSPLELLHDEYGYNWVMNNEGKDILSRHELLEDERGVAVLFSNSLVIKQDPTSGYFVNFYSGRKSVFSMRVKGGRNRTRRLAFSSVICWHKTTEKRGKGGAKEAL